MFVILIIFILLFRLLLLLCYCRATVNGTADKGVVCRRRCDEGSDEGRRSMVFYATRPDELAPPRYPLYPRRPSPKFSRRCTVHHHRRFGATYVLRGHPVHTLYTVLYVHTMNEGEFPYTLLSSSDTKTHIVHNALGINGLMSRKSC